MKYILGLDFGGTKLAAGLVNPQTGEIIKKSSCPTPVPKNADTSYFAMITMAKTLIGNRIISAVGTSFGGPVEADGRTIRLSMHVPGWENNKLAKKLENDFQVNCKIANDADSQALGEYCFGAGIGVRNMVYFTVSTGIGGGIIIDGKLYRGENAWAGEVGHITLKPDGPPCPCGRNGCLESLSSGLSIARTARKRMKIVPRKNITAKDVANAAKQNNKIAMELWNEAMEWIGIGIASVANVVNPGRIVIGGGLTKAGNIFFEPIRETASERTLDPKLEIVPAKCGEFVGIVGAASLMICRY